MRLKHKPEADGILESSPLYVPDPKCLKGQWKMSFGNDNPIFIEIGSGKGQFILEHARLHPDRNYIAIERYSSVLYKAVKKLARMEAGEIGDLADGKASIDVIQKDGSETGSIDNVRFVCDDATQITEWFAPGEVDRIYLNFSDPWPKARHEKRRLTAPNYLTRYKEIIADGGVIEFKTDNVDLFTYSVEIISLTKGWILEVKTMDLHDDPMLSYGNVMTEYEAKFSAQGKKICKLVARRTDEGDETDEK